MGSGFSTKKASEQLEIEKNTVNNAEDNSLPVPTSRTEHLPEPEQGASSKGTEEPSVEEPEVCASPVTSRVEPKEKDFLDAGEGERDMNYRKAAAVDKTLPNAKTSSENLEEVARGSPTTSGNRELDAVRQSISFIPEKSTRVPKSLRHQHNPQERILRKRTVNVTLHWMRHAFSCANLLEVIGAKWDGLVSLRSQLTPDPQLTNIGVRQAERAGHAFQALGVVPDVVLCSGLTRALETALFAFGPNSPYKGSVHPVPFVSERRGPLAPLRDLLPGAILHDDDNKLLETSNLQTKISQLFPTSMLPVGINWKYLQECGNVHDPSLDQFYATILPVVVSDILRDKMHKLSNPSEVNIVVVSHSHFMMEALKDCEGVDPKVKFRNASLWKENAGQFRQGRFTRLQDLLHQGGGLTQRWADCEYMGEIADLEECVREQSYERCIQKEAITNLINTKGMTVNNSSRVGSSLPSPEGPQTNSPKTLGDQSPKTPTIAETLSPKTPAPESPTPYTTNTNASSSNFRPPSSPSIETMSPMSAISPPTTLTTKSLSHPMDEKVPDQQADTSGGKNSPIIQAHGRNIQPKASGYQRPSLASPNSVQENNIPTSGPSLFSPTHLTSMSPHSNPQTPS